MAALLRLAFEKKRRADVFFAAVFYSAATTVFARIIFTRVLITPLITYIIKHQRFVKTALTATVSRTEHKATEHFSQACRRKYEACKATHEFPGYHCNAVITYAGIALQNMKLHRSREDT